MDHYRFSSIREAAIHGACMGLTIGLMAFLFVAAIAFVKWMGW